MLTCMHPVSLRARRREEALYSAIAEHARAGEVCPPMCELAPRAGYGTLSTAYKALQRLEAEGRIETMRVAGRLIVRFPSLAIETSDPTPSPPARRPIIEIAEVAARVAGLTLDELLDHRNRVRLYSRPRAVAMRLARSEGWSFPKIGQAFGRDSSTTIYNCRKVDRKLGQDPLMARLYKRTEDALRGVEPKPLPFAPTKHSRPRLELNDAGELSAVQAPKRPPDPLIWAIRREHPERCRAA